MTASTATGPRAPSIASAVARFMLGSLAAIAVVVVGGFFALRSVATHEAVRNTKSQAQTLGRLVQAAGLSDGVLRRDPRALRRLDDVVQGHVLRDYVIREELSWRHGRLLSRDG